MTSPVNMAAIKHSIFHGDGIRAWTQTTGGIAGMLLLVQFLTGALLAFYYVPSVDHAHTTVSFIEKVLSSGSWIRSLHHYGSQLLVLFLFLHIVRLFLSEAYLHKNAHWMASIAVLGLVMAGAGTGYSLPWDARGFFSTRVAEGLVTGLPFVGRNARLWLLGGSEISTLTLSRFFALHVLITPFVLLAVIVFRFFGSNIAAFFGGKVAGSSANRVCWPNLRRNALAAGLVFAALAMWSLKFSAPLGPSMAAISAEYLPRPGAQFLWLYQSLKYVPGALGSLVGVVLPVTALLILASLRWLDLRAFSRVASHPRRMIGGLILGGGALLVVSMTAASYFSDRKDTRTRQQLARQAAQEEAFRREPFTPDLLGPLDAGASNSQSSTPGGPPVPYVKFCVNCHGQHGEGARQGPLKFPPLIGISTKPRRTVSDIVALLNDPTAYGLEPPMRSFSSKLTEAEMKEIAEWVARLR